MGRCLLNYTHVQYPVEGAYTCMCFDWDKFLTDELVSAIAKGDWIGICDSEVLNEPYTKDRDVDDDLLRYAMFVL